MGHSIFDNFTLNFFYFLIKLGHNDLTDNKVGQFNFLLEKYFERWKNKLLHFDKIYSGDVSTITYN